MKQLRLGDSIYARIDEQKITLPPYHKSITKDLRLMIYRKDILYFRFQKNIYDKVKIMCKKNLETY